MCRGSLMLLWAVLALLEGVQLRTTAYEEDLSLRVSTEEVTSPPCSIATNVTSKLEKVGNSRYYFSDANERLNWNEARKWCSNHGLHLASIETEKEHKLLTAHVKAKGWHDYWLGGSDEGEEGRWTWVTGHMFSFTAWRPSQPDNQFGLQNCLEMMHDDLFPGDNWWDRECIYIQRFACETPVQCNQ